MAMANVLVNSCVTKTTRLVGSVNLLTCKLISIMDSFITIKTSSPQSPPDAEPTNPPRTPLSLHKATIIFTRHQLATPCIKIYHHSLVFNTRNTTYTLTSSDGSEYVIRFSESWETKTENEVAAISYIAKNTSLPVPEVVGFCTDVTKSPTGYEYILMEKLNGVCLGDIFRDLSLSRKKSVVESVVNILKVFQSLKFDKVGSFYFNKSENNNPELGSLLGTPKSRPQCNYLDYLSDLITSELENLQKSKFLMDGEGSDLVDRVINFRDKVCNLETTPISKIAQNVDFVFCHVDLHTFNLLVDEESLKITGIIDFEFSGSYPIDQEWYKVFSAVRVNDKASHFFRDGLRTMSDSDTLQECQSEEELDIVRNHFFQECKSQGVQTPRDIPGHDERALLHYFVKYICPWWIADEIQPLPEKWKRDRHSARERLKTVLDMYDC